MLYSCDLVDLSNSTQRRCGLLLEGREVMQKMSGKIITIMGSVIGSFVLVYGWVCLFDVPASSVFNFCLTLVFLIFIAIYGYMVFKLIKFSTSFKITPRLLTLGTFTVLALMWILSYVQDATVIESLPLTYTVIYLFILGFTYFVLGKVENINIIKYLCDNKEIGENTQSLLLGMTIMTPTI